MSLLCILENLIEMHIFRLCHAAGEPSNLPFNCCSGGSAAGLSERAPVLGKDSHPWFLFCGISGPERD